MANNSDPLATAQRVDLDTGVLDVVSKGGRYMARATPAGEVLFDQELVVTPTPEGGYVMTAPWTTAVWSALSSATLNFNGITANLADILGEVHRTGQRRMNAYDFLIFDLS